MDFWRLAADHALDVPMAGHYDPLLVVLSVVVASIAGMAALSVVDRMLATRHAKTRRWWLGIGALAMGCGVWAMHFTAMLAHSMGQPVAYDLGLTLASVLPAVLGSAAALRTMARPSVGWRRLQAGGLLMAAGIGCMHYTGMEAMRMSAVMRYEPRLFVASLLVAHVLATAALFVRFARSDAAGSLGERRSLQRVTSAVIMGLAVAGMHYTAMGAARFYPGPPLAEPVTSIPPYALAAAVALVTLAVLGLAILGTMIDQRLEEAATSARESTEWARTILDAAHDAIFTADADGGVLTWSRRSEEILGWTADEMIGRSVRTLLPEDAVPEGQELEDHFGRDREAGVDGVQHRIAALRKDGSALPVEFGVSVLLRDQGPVYVVSVRDISERQRLEQQLAQAQKLESIGQLAAGIAHEINTPTQFIGDNVQFLRDGFESVARVLDAQEDLLAGADDGRATPEALDKLRRTVEEADLAFLREEIPTALEQSAEGVERISGIVSAMREFSHPGAREQRAADLNQAVRNTLTVSRNAWKYVAEVQTELDPELPFVSCDLSEINQVILNLVTNAAHAVADANAQRGEAMGRITVSTRRDGDAVEIRVADTGTGIPEADRPRVFDPFFTTKQVGAGTGQGLAIAYDIVVRKHGGALGFETETGRGTTFVIRLPHEPDVDA